MKNTCRFKTNVSHNGDAAITVPTLEEYDAQYTGESGKFDNNLAGQIITGATSVTNSILDLFKKPTQNITYVTNGDESKKDNTMLYVGIGVVVLVVLLFLVIALKK